MQDTIKKYLNRFSELRRKHRRIVSIALVLSLLVTGGVFWQLKLTGLTLAGDAMCMQEEHVHTNACFARVLVCGMAEGEEHVHSSEAGCFAEEKVLCCTQEEHVHGEGCWETREVLACTEDHTHGRKCYEEQAVLICEVPEHTHDESCCEIRQVLQCIKEAGTAHVHTDACYADKLLCGKEEHIHTPDCYGDRSAAETQAEWEADLPEPEGDWALDLLAVAESQLGYQESGFDFVLGENGITKNGYTRYGDWYGNPYGAWCAMFVAFCMHYAQAEAEEIPVSSNCENWRRALEEQDLLLGVGEYEPQPGDLVLMDMRDAGYADHIGIVQALYEADENEAAERKLHTIEGNAGNAVSEVEYGFESGEEDERLIGFVDVRNLQALYDVPDENGDSDTGLALASEKAPSVFTYEDAALSLTLYVRERAESAAEEETAPPQEDSAAVESAAAQAEQAPSSEAAEETKTQNTEPALSASIQASATEPETEAGTVPVQAEPRTGTVLPADTVLSVTRLDEDADNFRELLHYMQENQGELLELHVLQFDFISGGESLDVSNLELTAQVRLTEGKSAELAGQLEEPENPAAEAEYGVVLSALEADGTEVTTLESVTLSAADSAAVEPMAVSLGANRTLALAASSSANPTFTVQYYAKIDTVDANATADVLTVIDTSAEKNGGVPKLPLNGVTPLTKELYLVQASDGKFKVATQETLMRVYSEKNFSYMAAPNLNYFDRLKENTNYGLIAVWVLKPGYSADSTAESDWVIYDSAQVSFTNNEAQAGGNVVAINSDTVLRLVYETTAGSYGNAANFYDYDITDGTSTTGLSSNENYKNTQYYNTNRQGINNFSGSGAKLVFGNMNTGNGFERSDGGQSWGGNLLNQYNKNGFKGCTFGLVTGLSGDQQIQYADGVSANRLFNEGTADGKTTISGRTLNFNRDGDTYTLSSISGSDLSGLEYFDHPSYNGGTPHAIWTNNFWPLDNVTGKDPKFGSNDNYLNKKLAYGVNQWGTPLPFPRSDDDLDHNSYFGMQYAVSFNLTEDYVGPLEYYFFGDDDMWVFLDGQLVCDIGGVHSSVGEYVDLWDYLQKDGASAGLHTLSFFYTERGASGSTCYMRFTLPSVMSATVTQNTGSLKVAKQVEAPAGSTEQEFAFTLNLDKKDIYPYTRYNSEGQVIGDGSLDLTIENGGTFQLRDDEYIIVRYLPNGTTATVTESRYNGYSTTVAVDGGPETASLSASGQIASGSQTVIAFVNTAGYELPHTGGAGIYPYVLIGLTLMTPLLTRPFRRRPGSERRAK